MREFIEKPIVAALLCLLILSCGGREENAQQESAGAEEGSSLPRAATPQDAYAQLVFAVKSRNYGAMYDLMDSANRHYTRMWFELNLQQLDLMDSSERAGWQQFKNITDPRERFIRLVEVTPPMRERFVNGYKVLTVDTVVAVVTQNPGLAPQLTYFRWEDGGYRYTSPPESRIAPAAVRVPSTDPPTPEGANKR